MFKLTTVLFLLFLSIHLSASVNADCVSTFDAAHDETHHQSLCNSSDIKKVTAKKNPDIIEGETLPHMRLSNRQPSLIESLIALIFIPGLILLWLLRFVKSNK